MTNEIRHLTSGHGVDATLITAASESDSIVQQAMEITRRKRTRLLGGGRSGPGPKRSPLYEKEIDFLISCSYGPGRYDQLYEERGVDYPVRDTCAPDGKSQHGRVPAPGCRG